jgi:hypothetical protein
MLIMVFAPFLIACDSSYCFSKNNCVVSSNKPHQACQFKLKSEKQNIHNMVSGELANKMYPTMCKKNNAPALTAKAKN